MLHTLKNTEYSIEEIREKSCTDHVAIRLTQHDKCFVFLNFMTTIRDFDHINENLFGLKTFLDKLIEDNPKTVVGFCEMMQVIKNTKKGIIKTRNPVEFLRTMYPNWNVHSIPYNDGEYPMNLVLLYKNYVNNINTIELGTATPYNRRSPRSALTFMFDNSFRVAITHLSFPRMVGNGVFNIADRDFQAGELGKYCQYSSEPMVIIGDFNYSIGNTEEIQKGLTCESNIDLLEDKRTFFGSDRDKYAVDNIKCVDDFSYLDGAFGNQATKKLKITSELILPI